MTLEIALVLGILAVSLVLFVTEWLRMDLVALLALSTLAILGLASSTEAVSGLRDPAVITVWAMFIMSEGLTRAGIADRIGRQMMRVAGRSEVCTIAIFMLVGGTLSAFMSGRGIDHRPSAAAPRISRAVCGQPSRAAQRGGHQAHPPGRAKLAADDRLQVQGDEAALERLRAATEFSDARQVAENELREQWRLDERLFVLHIPQDGALGGSTIGDSGIGDLFDFRLLGVFRDGTLIPRTASGEVLAGGDLLLVQGREEDLDVLRGLQQLERLQDATPYLGVFDEGHLELVEATLHPVQAQPVDARKAPLAAGLMSAPRPVLISRTPGFIWANAPALIIRPNRREC
jgi:hypothetical protein